MLVLLINLAASVLSLHMLIRKRCNQNLASQNRWKNESWRCKLRKSSMLLFLLLHVILVQCALALVKMHFYLHFAWNAATRHLARSKIHVSSFSFKYLVRAHFSCDNSCQEVIWDKLCYANSLLTVLWLMTQNKITSQVAQTAARGRDSLYIVLRKQEYL